MSIYVDKSKNQFKNMIMCHMLADTLEELHAMAKLIGMRRSWFQPQSTPHYDLSRTMRRRAIRAGAIEIDREKVVELIRKWRENEKTNRSLTR